MGVLFIIWIPCESYEQILSKKKIWHTVTQLKEPMHFTNSFGDDEVKELKQASSETLAISIESDSLERDGVTDKQRLKRTKSADDLAAKKNVEESSGDKRGSMDSDQFRRLSKLQDDVDINAEAVDRFFNASVKQQTLDAFSTMECVVREIIERIHIKNSSWVRVSSGNSYQVTFSLENGKRCDDTIHMLSEFGIGQKEGSSIAIIPCTLYTDRRRSVKVDDEASTTSGQSTLKETAWNKFIGTVRARMNVAKIVDTVRSDATLSFDFFVLLICASILASFGLVEDSTLFLAASMLISPLMGPILAATFGAVIKDHKLQYWGLKNEIIGIFMCIFVGFIFGLIYCGINSSTEEEKMKLTQEMIARTQLHSVFVGICIALPSGAAVAISVLGNNFGSLVGVAISASLLPPAVNTGLLWAFSCVHAIFKDAGNFKKFVKEPTYSENQALELLSLGGISLCVTLTNVLCVYVMGYIFLKVKEVAPVSSADQRQFWKHDIKIARDYNKTIQAEEGRKFKEELAPFHGNASENFKGVGAELLRQSHYPHTNTWSPLTLRHFRKEVGNTRTSVHDFDSHHLNYGGKSDNEKQNQPRCNFQLNRNSTQDVSPDLRSKPFNSVFNSPKQTNDFDPITETPKRIRCESTLVSVEGRPSTSGINKKKFIVTPAHDDPLI